MNAGAPKIAPPISAPFASKVEPSAPVPSSMQLDTLSMAMIAQRNRVGTPGVDLLSRNFNWGVSLVDLPGRAGMDLNLDLFLNSLIWIKNGTNIHFNPQGGSLSPGFRLGLPEIGELFRNFETGTDARLVTMPSGRRYEFRLNPALGPNVYEEMSSTYMLLVLKTNPLNNLDKTWNLLLPNGATYKFKIITDTIKLIEAKDRNGNYISFTYTSSGQLSVVTDTLNRPVNFNYDSSNRLTSITQNWSGATHTYATFAYDALTIRTGFEGLAMVGAANGDTISVLSRVTMADGKIYAFEYNTYAQVRTIKCFAPDSADPGEFPDDYTLLSSISYNLAPNEETDQTDCPRFSLRTDWAKDWNDGVETNYDGDGVTWGEVSSPDGTTYKEFYGESGWQRGLTLRTETWSHDSLKKWTTSTWVNGNPNVSYWLNPRVIETNVYDEKGNQRRITAAYADFGAVSDVREYDAPNTSTVLRHTHFEYLRGPAYTGNLNRRLTQLVKSKSVYDENGALQSKVINDYDLGGDFLVHPAPPEPLPIRYDATNFGPNFVQGRGNLNRISRCDVTDPDNIDKCVPSTVGYNTSGSVIFSRDPLGHETKFSYTDSFSDSVNRNTFAYPTTITVTDDEDYSSMIQYNYNFGAVTRTEDPKGAATVNSYDPIGRLSQVRSEVNEAYTRYVYAPNHLSVQSFTTVNDLGSEFYQITVFNGHGKVRGVASDHPGSVGGYKAQSYEYDDMGRLSGQTNPTEINASWQVVGDDIGWEWSRQDYDWQSLPTLSTNQDGTTKLISYDGCGCAGGRVVETRDEMGRTQKIYSDALGRSIKTEELLSDGSVYRTTTTKYNVRDQIEEVKSIAGSAGAFQVATNEYDSYGRLSRRKLPIEGANSLGTRYTYNDDDTVNTITDPRDVVSTYSYNGRGMVTMISFDDGGSPDIADVGPISFTYDAAGNRVGMIDDTGSSEYHYNSLSRIEWEKRRFNGLSQDYYIHYQYNLAGQIKEIKDPFNDVIYYNYDKAGQITSVTGSNYAEVTQYTSTETDSLVKYRAWGAIKHLKYGNGLTTNVGYDARMRVGSFEINGRNPQFGPPLAAQAEHQYYADGRLRYSKDNTAHKFDRAFQYDDVGRVKEAYTGVEARNFVNQPRPGSDGQGPYRQSPRFDHWGNLVSDTPRFWSQNINVSAGFETATGRRVELGWDYDDAGNIIKAADNGVTTNHHYKYDARSLNVEASTGESALIENPKSKKDSYKYDGDGRVGKRTFLKFAQGINFAPRVTYYIYSAALGGALLTELYWTGTKKTGYVRTGSILLAEQNVTETATPFKYVNWQHSNPVTGSAGYSNADGSYGPQVESDALGTNIGLSEPVARPEPPNGSSLANAGIHYRGQGSCQVDGLDVDCYIARIMVNAGAAVVAPPKKSVALYSKLDNKFVGFAHWNGQSPNANGDYEFTYSLFYNDGGFHPVTGEPTLGYAVSSVFIRTATIDVMSGEPIGGGGLSQSKKGVRRRSGKKRPPQVPTTVDPALKSPCYGMNPSDLDYDYSRTYNDGVTETARDHILRNHTVPTKYSTGWFGPGRLAMLAGFLKKSLYGSNAKISASELYDHIRETNSETFNFGKMTPRLDQSTGNVTAFIFEHEYQETTGPNGLPWLKFVGVEYNPSTKTVSHSRWNTLILDPNCKTVQTSFPGRLQ